MTDHIVTDYKPEHYRFQRTQNLYTPPLKKSEPLRPWIADILGFIGIIFLTALAHIAVGVLFNKTDSKHHDPRPVTIITTENRS